MEKLVSISLCIFLSMALIVTSCKKDDATKSNTDLLTAKTWKVTNIEVGFGGGFVDITRACDKDNTVKFTKPNVYLYKTGADNCDGEDNDFTGTWAWKDGEKTISVMTDSTTANTDAKLITLSETTLVTQLSVIYDGAPVDSKVTFTNK